MHSELININECTWFEGVPRHNPWSRRDGELRLWYVLQPIAFYIDFQQSGILLLQVMRVANTVRAGT